MEKNFQNGNLQLKFPRGKKKVFSYSKLLNHFESTTDVFLGKMLKTSDCKILFCEFIIIVMATSSSLGSANEGKYSYYLISPRNTERFEFTQVNRVLDEEGCLSLCNRDDGCSDVVYNNEGNTGTCFMKPNRKRGVNDKAIEISKWENVLHFNKVC